MFDRKEHTLSRREALKLSAAGVLSGSLSGWFNVLAQDGARSAAQGARHKSCILLWMEGGPSQQHTFDLKAGGDYQAIATSVPGISISEYLPRLAQQMQHVVLLRSMSHQEGVHQRARFLLHTGYRQVGQELFPALGSIVSAELGQPAFDLPNFVCIDGGIDGNNGPGSYHPMSAYLGAAHSPLMITDPTRGIPELRAAIDPADFAERAELLSYAERSFLERDRSRAPAAEAHQTSYQQAIRLMRSEKVKAFEIEREPLAVRELYGRSKFGQACLLARRLVETGIPFVEVTLRGWDDHGSAAVNVRRRSPYVDRAMAALISDLKDRGSLDSTLVIWMGEFGRSPGTARNHFPRAFSAVLAGAGLRTGQVIGQTDASGADVRERPISPADFMATVCRALQIDANKRHVNRGGRPVRIVDTPARPITELQ